MQNSNQKTDLWKKSVTVLEELIFPKRCLFCKKYDSILCADCAALADVSPVHRADRSHKYLDDIYSACSYENRFIQKAILALKYEPFLKEMAAPLSQLVAGHFALAQPGFDFGQTVIVSVPLAQKRKRWRGYNQAEELAVRLGEIWERPMIGECLKRTRNTACQAELSRTARRENVRNAFVCTDPARIKNKIVCLVDDVVTTGATMEDCARALKKSGAVSVIGISVARTEDT